MRDGLVDLLDGGLELAAGEVVVASELRLEVLHLLLEVRDVDVLIAYLGELGLVRKRRKRGVAQDADNRDEELRADDVHLLVTVAHVDDTLVVELVFGLEHRHEHRVLAVLLLAIGVEFLQEVLVFVLVSAVIALVFHLEHDGDDLVALVVRLPEHEIALRTIDHVVVLLEVRLWEGGGAHLVELDLAVLLERLAHHLGGKTGLHLLVAGDFLFLVCDELVFCAELRRHLLAQRTHFLLTFGSLELHLRSKVVALALNLGPHLRDGELLLGREGRLLGFELLRKLGDLRIAGGGRVSQGPLVVGLGYARIGCALVGKTRKLRLELDDFGVFARGNFGECRNLLGLRRTGSRVIFPFDRGEVLGQLRDFRIAGSDLVARLPAHLLARKRHRLFTLFGEKFLATLDFPIELRVAHLLHDVRKARLVHLKHRPTMRTLNLVHRNLPVTTFGA